MKPSPTRRFDFLRIPKISGHSRVRRWLLIGSCVLGVLLLMTLLVLPPLLGTLSGAKQFRRELTTAQLLIAAERFQEAQQRLTAAEQGLTKAQRSFRGLSWLAPLPVVGNNIKAGRDLLRVGNTILDAARRVAAFAENLLSPVAAKRGHLTFGGLSATEREQLLKRLGDAQPALEGLNQDVATIVKTLDNLPSSYVQRRVAKLLETARDNLVAIQDALQRAAPIARVLPKLLGHAKPQTYLFLLQNNSELRPSGGFIGTYGIIKIRDGEITSFTTDNSYNLDDRVKGSLSIPAPAPLQKYNSAERWFFRDANWSPDFREAAGKTSWFYHQEGGAEKLDGVLAITPDVITELLGLTGPITVDGVTFTQANFLDTLQDQVTYAFAQKGIAQSNRKDIIGAMGKQLITKLFALPQNDWRDLWLILLRELNEKQFLINFNDQELQAFAENQNWAGAVQSTTGDFLLLADANLASLKTDPTVKRTIDYQLAAAGDQLKATVKVSYVHTGTFTKKTTRYRTYLRLYVPLGSTLVDSQGADLTDRSTRPGHVTTSEELGKTVFGAFKSIEPGTTETISFTYTLPPSIKDLMDKGHYSLLAQKQAGTLAHALNLSWKFPRPATAASGVDNPAAGAHTQFSLETTLRRDRHFGFTLTP